MEAIKVGSIFRAAEDDRVFMVQLDEEMCNWLFNERLPGTNNGIAVTLRPVIKDAEKSADGLVEYKKLQEAFLPLAAAVVPSIAKQVAQKHLECLRVVRDEAA